MTRHNRPSKDNRLAGSLAGLLLGAISCQAAKPEPIVPAKPVPTAIAPAEAAPPPSEAPLVPPAPESPTTPEDAERVLFLATHLRTDELRRACPTNLAPDTRIRCLILLRYEGETESLGLALTLYTETGSLAGLLPEETTDDGHGGRVHLMPARPLRHNAEHLRWIIDAFRDYARFEAAIEKRGEVSFEYKPIHFRFFYSETGAHPSAFAIGRNIGYNLYGALNVSDEAVRDTLFHEIFHLNDAWHDRFAERALSPIFDRVVALCGAKDACLSRYSPSDTRMGGVLYAFHPKGGVKEYAAELGLRYYREHRLVIAGEPLPVTPFKCGPEENREAWRLVKDEMFGGVDLIAECK